MATLLGALLRNESGGRNIPNVNQGTSSGQAQGYFQITTGTWDEFGGKKFAPNPLQATYAQQAAIASQIPLKRWDNSTLAAMRGTGLPINPNATLGENLSSQGEGFGSGPSVPQSGHAALLQPPQTSNAADGSGATQPSLLAPPLSMLPPILDTAVKPGDAFSPSQILAERHPMMADAMQSFQQGYSSDRFMSDMLAGANPMRRMVFGALGNLFRSAFA
jgi:hypothetical protein